MAQNSLEMGKPLKFAEKTKALGPSLSVTPDWGNWELLGRWVFALDVAWAGGEVSVTQSTGYPNRLGVVGIFRYGSQRYCFSA